MHCKREEEAKKKLKKKNPLKIIKTKERKCLYKTEKHTGKNAGPILWPFVWNYQHHIAQDLNSCKLFSQTVLWHLVLQ